MKARHARGAAWPRLVLWLLGAVALFAAAALLALSMVDWKARVQALAAQVELATGRAVHIDGEVELGLLPPRLIVTDVRFANADWGSRPDMLHARRIELGTTLAALLAGDLRLDLSLLEPELLLETAHDGRRNWHFARPGASGRTSDEAGRGPGEPAQPALPVRRLLVEDARIEIREAASEPSRELAIRMLDLFPRAAGGTSLRIQALVQGRSLALEADTEATLESVATRLQPVTIDYTAGFDQTALAGELTLHRDTASPRLTGSLRSDRIAIHRDLALTEVTAELTLADRRLSIAPLSARLGTGTLSGEASVDAAGSGSPRMAARLSGEGLVLGEVARALGHGELLEDGTSRLHLELRGRAGSGPQLAESLDGHVRLSSGPARLANRRLSETGELARRVLAALDPAAAQSEFTRLRCIVVNSPVRRGVMQVSNDMAFETDRIGASFAGSIDLVRNRLDLAVRPSALAGSDAGLGQLAGLIRIQGPLDAPRVRVDERGAAGLALGLGAELARGGLPALGRRLLEGARGPGTPCKDALAAH